MCCGSISEPWETTAACFPSELPCADLCWLFWNHLCPSRKIPSPSQAKPALVCLGFDWPILSAGPFLFLIMCTSVLFSLLLDLLGRRQLPALASGTVNYEIRPHRPGRTWPRAHRAGRWCVLFFFFFFFFLSLCCFWCLPQLVMFLA